MKTKYYLLIVALLTISIQSFSQIQLNVNKPDIKYESEYNFDAGIDMDMIFYNKKGAHRMTIPYKSYYSNNKKYICIKILRKNSVYQTLFDFPNNNCLILQGENKNMTASSAVMKKSEAQELKTLPLTKTEETKEILGYTCNQYTYNADRFHGEFWVTTEIDLPNDVGVLKASKMGKYYEIIPVNGFILELTSITPRGLKTLMQTTALNPNSKHSITLPKDIGTAVNKINYYAY